MSDFMQKAETEVTEEVEKEAIRVGKRIIRLKKNLTARLKKADEWAAKLSAATDTDDINAIALEMNQAGE